VKITILQNSGEVPKDLWEKEDEIHIQLTKVEPHFTQEDLESEDRKTMAQKAFSLDEFMYETPFTTASAKERHSSSVADQWKMHTILKTEHKFPYLATRIRVAERREIRQTPMEVAIEAIATRTERLRSAVQARDPKMIQIILQGSCLPTVNGGPMELCRAFLQMLPVVFEDELGTSTGDVDEDEDEYEDEFMDDDEDFGEDNSESIRRNARSPSITSVAKKVSAEEASASQASTEEVPASSASPVPGISEEDRKAAALAEETRLNPENQQKLRDNVREFLKACSMALHINKVLSSDQNLFNKELSNGYEKLCDELYPFVGAITGAPGIMGSQRALQTAKPRASSVSQPPAPSSPVKSDGNQMPSTPYRAAVNGYLIPSVMHERRKSHRMKKSGSVSGSGSSAVGSAAGGSSSGSARGKIGKSETFATISLTLAQKRADESADGDPNSGSLSNVGVPTPATTRGSRKSQSKRLSVLSPVNPSASSSSSSSAVAGKSTAVTPLKARVSCDYSQSSNDDDVDSSSVSSIDSESDDDVDVVDVKDEATKEQSSKKSGRHEKHHRRHHKSSE